MALVDQRNSREILNCIQTGIDVHTGAVGSSRTESGTISIRFTDRTDLTLNDMYFSDDTDEGFMKFQFCVVCKTSCLKVNV